MRTYRTSEIARVLGVHPNTVILYEKWGYIAPIERKKNGYRIYTETHLDQMKLVRLALRSELIKSYMKFEVQNIIRSAAQGNLTKALELSTEYLTHIQNESDNGLKIVKKVHEIMKSDSSEEENILLKRNDAAKLLAVSIDVLINWESNGLLEVPRNKSGYRIYGKDEIKQLKIIKVLRQENYRTQCICKMLKKLKTKSKGNYLLLSEETEDSDDWLMSSLAEVSSNIKKLIWYIGELINKKAEIERGEIMDKKKDSYMSDVNVETVSSVNKVESIKSFQSSIRKSEKALEQMIQKGANTTLVKKRLKALHIGLAMLESVWNQKPHHYTQEDLAEARTILTGLFPSIENIYVKLKAGTPQRTLLERRIKAFELAAQAIDDHFNE